MLPPEVQLELQRSFGVAAPYGPSIARAFYVRLFQLEPSARALFPADMEAQEQKLIAMLAWIVAHVDEPEALDAALGEAGRRHAGYGVRADHYAPVGSALIYALRTTLGGQLTADAEDAWIEAYAYFAREMETAA